MKKKRPGKRKAFHHFKSSERSSLLVYLMLGMSVAAIVKRMRKDPSSIYRELIRDSKANVNAKVNMYNVGKLPIEELLPWSEKVPDEIHIHKKDLERRTD